MNHRRTHHARKGLTFLETILAAVILVGVVSVVMSALNMIYGQSERQVARLGAMELANRLMMIFLDDEGEFMRQPKRLEFDGRWYGWDWKESGVQVVPVAQGDSANAIRSAERLRNIRIDVWLAPESESIDAIAAGAPSASVVRLVDVIYMNPDSIQNTVSSDEGQRRLIERVTRSRSGSSGRGTTSPTLKPTNPPSANPGKGGAK